MRRAIVNRVCAVWALCAGMALAAGPIESFKEKPREKLSAKEVSDWGEMALAIAPGKWKHGETEHFIIHFTKGGDGEKVGRRTEAFYQEIREFFGNRPDLMKGQKSHVFAFGEPDDWAKFAAKIEQAWAAGITRGNEFFYNVSIDAGRMPGKAKVTAHEMTHLIFNRFFPQRIPLWLNEGIAEYFGQRKTSTITEFRRQMGMTPPFHLGQLMEATAYPSNQEQIQAFYAESAIIVDFLTRTSERAALLPKFVEAMSNGGEIGAALKIYGFKDWADFEKEYKKYRRRF